MLDDEFLYLVDYELNELRENLLLRIMGEYAEDYYEIIAQMPLWFCEGGFSDEINISKGKFELYYKKCLQKREYSNIESTITKTLNIFLEKHKHYTDEDYKDLFYRLYTYDNAFHEISFLQNALYELHYTINLIDNMYHTHELSHNNENKTNKEICFIETLEQLQLRILINSFFLTAGTMLDYLSKIQKYFLHNYKKLTELPSVKRVYWSNSVKIKDTLFDENNILIKKIRTFRNEIAHEGGLYLNLRFYESVCKNGKRIYSIKFPDFNENGEISDIFHRHLFYSQSNDPLNVIREIYAEIQNLLKKTIDTLVDLDTIELKKY